MTQRALLTLSSFQTRKHGRLHCFFIRHTSGFVENELFSKQFYPIMGKSLQLIQLMLARIISSKER